MSIAHDWVEGPVALGARGGAQEEVGVGTLTEIAAVPMMAWQHGIVHVVRALLFLGAGVVVVVHYES